jgi:hypothetical protein
MQRSFLLLAIALMGVLSACKKAEPTGPADLKVEFSHMMGSSELYPDYTYHLANTDSVRFTSVKYWVSNVVLLRADGSELALPNSYYLVDATADHHSELVLPNVPRGSYNGIRFLVGLDSAANHANPLNLPQGSVLNNPGMHWGWNPAAGYKFLVVEGQVWDGAGAKEGLTYHIANMRNVMTVSLNRPFTVGSDNEFYIKADYQKLFQTLDMPADKFTMSSPNAATLTNKIVANVETVVFTATEGHDHDHN